MSSKAAITVDIDKLQEQIETFIFETGMSICVSREREIIILRITGDNKYLFVNRAFGIKPSIRVREFKSEDCSEYKDFECNMNVSKVFKAIAQVHTERAISRVLGK